jgi:hypothetical protein
MEASEPVYDRIGGGYAGGRRADPRIAAALAVALGDADRVLNIGAGTGSYEPGDRPMVAADPSPVMLAQRPAGSAPCVQAAAEALPFGDGTFGAAMAVLTIHHWRDKRPRPGRKGAGADTATPRRGRRHPHEGTEYRLRGRFHEIRPDRIVQTFTFEGDPDGVALDSPSPCWRYLKVLASLARPPLWPAGPGKGFAAAWDMPRVSGWPAVRNVARYRECWCK